MHNLAWGYQNSLRFREAASLYEDISRAKTRSLDFNDPSTLQTLFNLATSTSSGRNGAGRSGHVELLKRQRRKLGTEDPSSPAAWDYWGECTFTRSCAAEAEPVLRESWRSRPRKLPRAIELLSVSGLAGPSTGRPTEERGGRTAATLRVQGYQRPRKDLYRRRRDRGNRNPRITGASFTMTWATGTRRKHGA